MMVNQSKKPISWNSAYRTEPGAKPFVKVGQKVKKGETVIIVEAMKTMNHVQSTESGEVVEICVQDGEAVEYDQILVKIK